MVVKSWKTFLTKLSFSEVGETVLKQLYVVCFFWYKGNLYESAVSWTAVEEARFSLSHLFNPVYFTQ